MAKSNNSNTSNNLRNVRSGLPKSSNGILTPNPEQNTVENKADDKLENSLKKMTSAITGSVDGLAKQLTDLAKQNNTTSSVAGSSISQESLVGSIQPLQDMICGVLSMFGGSFNLQSKIKDGGLKPTQMNNAINWWKSLYATKPTDVVDFILNSKSDNKVENKQQSKSSSTDINIIFGGNKAFLDSLQNLISNKIFEDMFKGGIEQGVVTLVGHLNTIADTIRKGKFGIGEEPIRLLHSINRSLTYLGTVFETLEDLNTDIPNIDVTKITDSIASLQNVYNELSKVGTDQKINFDLSSLVDVRTFISNLSTILTDINDMNGIDSVKVPAVVKTVKDLFIRVNELSEQTLSVPDLSVFNKFIGQLNSLSKAWNIDTQNIQANINLLNEYFGTNKNTSIIGILNDIAPDVKKLSDSYKEVESSPGLKDIGTVLSAIANLGNFANIDENGKPLQNLKLLKDITNPEKNIGTVFGLNHRGLLKSIIDNVISLGENIKEVDNTGIKSIANFLYSLSNISTPYSLDGIKNLEEYCNDMMWYFQEDGILTSLVDTYNTFVSNLKTKNIGYDESIQKAVSAPFLSIEPILNSKTLKDVGLYNVIPFSKLFSPIVNLYDTNGWLTNLLKNYRAFRNVASKMSTDTDKVSSIMSAPFIVLSNMLNGAYKSISLFDLLPLYGYNKALTYSEDVDECGVVGELFWRWLQLNQEASTWKKQLNSNLLYKVLNDPFKTISDIVKTTDSKDIDILNGMLLSLRPIKYNIDWISKEFNGITDDKLDLINLGLVGIYYIVDEVNKLNEKGEVDKAKLVSVSCVEMLRSMTGITSAVIDSTKDIDIAISSLNKIADISKPDQSFIPSLKSLVDLVVVSFSATQLSRTVKTISEAEQLVDSLAKLVVRASVAGHSSKSAIKAINAMVKVTESLNTIVNKLENIDGIDKATQNAKNVLILIGVASLTMVAAVGISLLVVANIIPLMTFSVALSTFIFGTLKAYSLGSKGVDDATLNAEKFGILVAVSAGILMLGGAIMTYHPELVIGALLFTVSLATFTGALLFVFSKFGDKAINNSMHSAEKFSVLVAACAGIMMVGAAFMTTGLFVSAMKFTGALVLFIGTLMGGIALLQMFGLKKQLHSMEQFAILIGASTLCLMVGATFMLSNLWKESLKFAGVLTAFILGLGLGYALVTQIGGKNEIKSMKAFAEMVAVSAGVLVIGGLVMMIPGMPEAITEFALIFGGFVLAMSLAMGIMSLLAGKKGMLNMIGFAIVTLVAGGLLLFAGKMYLDNPGIDEAINSFVDTTLKLVIGMGVICFVLGRFWKYVAIGEAAMLGMIILTYLMGQTMGSIIGVMDQVGGRWDDLDKMLYRTGIVFGAVLAVVAGIATAVGIPGIGEAVVAALGTAELIVGGLVAIIWGIGKAMSAIAQAMIDFNKVGSIDFTKISTMIVKFAGIGLVLGECFNPLVSAAVAIATPTILALSTALGKIADTTQKLANLTMPLYDENGKKIGETRLTTEEIKSAAVNIGTVITTIGGAIQQLYNNNPDMFGNWATSFFHQDTPFTRVVKSCMNMGNMISVIAEGVKDMADLNVPVYVNGKKKGVRPLKDEDFELAANNIATIVTTIGGAIVNLYSGKVKGVDQAVIKEMFATEGLSGWLGTGKATSNTIFGRTIISCTAMGNMVSSIANGLKNIADLKIPVYKDGKIVNYETISTADFDKVGNNIRNIIVCIASALADVYNNNKILFDDPSAWYVPGNKSPLAMMIKSSNGIGKVITEMANSIKAVSNMRIQKYDANGKPIKDTYEEIKGLDKLVNENGQVNKSTRLYKILAGICTIIPGTFAQVYQDNEKLFDDNAEGIEIVKKSVTGVNSTVNEVISMIKAINAQKLDDDSITALKTNIKGIMSLVPLAISAAYIDAKETENDGIYKVMMNDQDELVSNLQTRAKSLSESLKCVFGVHKLMLENAFNNGKEFNKARTIALENNVATIIGLLPRTFKTLTQEENSIEFFNEDFTSRLDKFLQYYKSFQVLLTPDEKIDTSSAESMSKTIYDFNDKLKTIQKDNVTEFGRETQYMHYFTKSINTLDSGKTSQMIELISSINQMAANINGLDNFTKTLANDLAVVLKHLTDQLKQSAATIATAEKIQKSRHENIEKSISKMNDILNNPVQVIVSQKEADANDQTPDDQGGKANSFQDSGYGRSSGTPASFDAGVGSDMSIGEQSVVSYIKNTMLKLSGGGSSNNASKPYTGRGSSKS